MIFRSRLVFVALWMSALVICGCVSIDKDFSLQPPQASVLYQRAYNEYQSHHWQEASIYFHQYLREYPATDLTRVAIYYLGHCEEKLGNSKDALHLYNTILTKFPEDDFWVEAAKKRIEEISRT